MSSTTAQLLHPVHRRCRPRLALVPRLALEPLTPGRRTGGPPATGVPSPRGEPAPLGGSALLPSPKTPPYRQAHVGRAHGPAGAGCPRDPAAPDDRRGRLFGGRRPRRADAAERLDHPAALGRAGAGRCFLLTESVQLDIEFRRQTFSVSPSEVALVIGLVEVGGVWTAVARVGAVAIVLARRPAAAQGRLQPLPRRRRGLHRPARPLLLPPLQLDDPLTWLSLVLALVGGHGGRDAADLPGDLAGRRVPGLGVPLRRGARAGRGPAERRRRRDRAAADRGDAWAWALIVPLGLAVVAIFRQSTHAVRRAAHRPAGLRLRPPGRAGHPRRGGHPGDRQRRPGAAQRGPGRAVAAALPGRGPAARRRRRRR